MALVLGIDPGSRITGYGIVNAVGPNNEYVTSGCIRTSGNSIAERLLQIFEGVSEIITQFQPQEMAIEEVFMAKNANSALKLGQARGAAIVATMNSDVPVSEYSARKVKQSVVGNGAADKAQVQHMVRTILKLPSNPQEDAADALAIALCHIHTQQSLIKMAGAKSSRRGRLLG